MPLIVLLNSRHSSMFFISFFTLSVSFQFHVDLIKQSFALELSTETLFTAFLMSLV